MRKEGNYGNDGCNGGNAFYAFDDSAASAVIAQKTPHLYLYYCSSIL